MQGKKCFCVKLFFSMLEIFCIFAFVKSRTNIVVYTIYLPDYQFPRNVYKAKD